MTRKCLVLMAALALAAVVPAAAQDAQSVQIQSNFFAGITGAGARAMGMGGAFIAVADDATASSWNPAGLCVLEKPEAAIVGEPVVSAGVKHPAATFDWHQVAHYWPGHTEEGRSISRYEPWNESLSSRSFDFLSVTYPFRYGKIKLVPQISYQRAVDLGFDDTEEYGYQTESTYVGTCTTPYCTQNSTATSTSTNSINATSGGGIDVWAASLGVSFTPKLFLGLAVNRWGGGADASITTNYQGTGPTYDSRSNTDTTIKQDVSGTSLNLGALAKPTPKVNLGLVFKLPFDMSLTREETYAYSSTSNGEFNNSNSSTTTLDGTLRWPRTIGAGVAVMPTDFLTLSADLSFTAWSNAKFTHSRDYSYQSVNAGGTTYANSTHEDERTRFWPLLTDPDQPERDPQTGATNSWQSDSRQLRLGAEYVVQKPGALGLIVLPIRLGFVSDGQLAKSTPEMETFTNVGLTAGFGLVWKQVSLDVAYVHLRGKFNAGFDYTLPPNPTFWYEYTFREREKNTVSMNRLIVSTVVRFK